MTAGNKKLKVAFFDFACCEGCQLNVLELGEQLLDLMAQVEFVEWRELMTGKADRYDVAFCEGSITRARDVERLKDIRRRTGILVSLGSCASIGCHNELKNNRPMGELLKSVYGKDAHLFDTQPARPVAEVVPVDYRTLGCPVSLPEFVSVCKHILIGREYHLPNQPVCVECKLNDTLCVFEKGRVCLGPVTRCGCDAICTQYGDVCHGCRGLIEEANLEAALRVLTGDQLHAIMDAVVKRHGLDRRELRAKLAVYYGWPAAGAGGNAHAE
jgi:coenzyme F420-reducing hydrogenase gamma subunit